MSLEQYGCVEMVVTHEWMRPAASGREDIFSKLWRPAIGEPCALVQIAHGMCETVARYDAFAGFLADKGFAVCMNEHAGHGKHAKTLGYFGEKGGADFLVEDMKRLMDEVAVNITDAAGSSGIPVFLIGHSMGSFLARKYITLHGRELSGVVLSGTAGKNPGVSAGKVLATIQRKIKGGSSPARFIFIIAFGSYNKRIKNPVNSHAWLTRDEDVCRAYKEDPYCGFPLTAAGYYDLFSLHGEVNAKSWPGKVPKGLPIFLLSGSEDPVGTYGKGVMKVYQRLKESGHEYVTVTLYPGGRHEMLNETNREEVYADIVRWLEAQNARN